MTRRRCIRLTVPAAMHEHPVMREPTGDLLIADWKLRGAWRRSMNDDTTPPAGVPIVGAA